MQNHIATRGIFIIITLTVSAEDQPILSAAPTGVYLFETIASALAIWRVAHALESVHAQALLKCALAIAKACNGRGMQLRLNTEWFETWRQTKEYSSEVLVILDWLTL